MGRIRRWRYKCILLLIPFAVLIIEMLIMSSLHVTEKVDRFKGRFSQQVKNSVHGMASDGLETGSFNVKKSNYLTTLSRNVNIYETVKGIPEEETLCCSNLFCKDNVPPNKIDIQMSGYIHFCISAGNAGVIWELGPLVKSILLHAKRSGIFLHLLTGAGSENEVKDMMDSINQTAIEFFYELVPLNPHFIVSECSKINLRISHHSGVWGMSKAFMYKIFTNVDKCIILDTDVVFGTDPAFLWDLFFNHGDHALITMKISNDMAKQSLSNSGVMLHDFGKMRKIEFAKLYQAAVQLQCTELPNNSGFRSGCGDQALFFGTFRNNNSHLYRSLPLSWNLEMCYKNFTFVQHSNIRGTFFGIAHLDCNKGPENQAFQIFVRKYYVKNLTDYVKYLIHAQINKVCSV
ncbi:hypothetical protein CHS0354_011448 [Potamilus streckersoni]|uniref:Glycosyltransferase n=1 Tax=Potamilus streckersoni TaxID=2493646 RepID=A0AAE0SL27_9BIVA|nr:hypothetical protein CHS0354_011448 [Potamilus streckersoni]